MQGSNIILIFCFLVYSNVILPQTMDAFKIGFESNSNTTATLDEIYTFYEKLVEAHPTMLQMNDAGLSDVGVPIKEIIFDVDGDFSPKKNNKVCLLINNAIHAGEPCGVDATMMLLRDILFNKKLQSTLKQTKLIIIPAYNIGGVLNRNSHTRTNQDGPESYGFRANIKNLDLNRDFVKCDSKNAKTFNALFNKWSPDVFVDNHTSNGADYQYTMTLIPTQKDKLHPIMSKAMTEGMLPYLYKKMNQKEWEMTPYVYAKSTPDEGIMGFLDLPRYSSGYASLFQTLSFMPETHMLKPYKDRVLSTYAFMESMIEYLSVYGIELASQRKKALELMGQSKSIDIQWTIDKDRPETFQFKGYEAKYKPSDIHGQKRLYYDRSQPYEKQIPFLNNYKATKSINIPKAYIIPQAYDKIIERFTLNNIDYNRLEKDTLIDVEMYYISKYETVDGPYEGHYLHHSVEIKTEKRKHLYRKGDLIVDPFQKNLQYIVHTLEPEAPDSFFAWNFFDGILMQKEYYSAYVFEDLAVKLLSDDQELKKAFDDKKGKEDDFAKDGNAQLEFIYQHSHHHEYTHNLYPVGRILH